MIPLTPQWMVTCYPLTGSAYAGHAVALKEDADGTLRVLVLRHGEPVARRAVWLSRGEVQFDLPVNALDAVKPVSG